jgi:hypothetical protein
LHIDADDLLYCTDDAGHFVRKCTTEGKVLLEIGVPGTGNAVHERPPLSSLHAHALSPKGEIYVSDGYGNARVHKYSPDGKLLLSWGEPGTDAGQFNIPHNIATDAEGWVYVADRENHRVQVFDGNGKYETQWMNIHRPCGLYCCGGHKPRFIIGELGPMGSVNRFHRISGPACRSSIAMARSSRASAARLGPASRPESSSRRTASRSMRAATSMSAR